MPPKKGLSRDEKLIAIQDLMMESKDVWSLKELEKECPRKKSISAMLVKDIVQELCDTDMISSDKIGSGNFYWCFPSEAFNRRKVQENQLLERINGYEQEIASMQQEIIQLEPGREDCDERTNLNTEIAKIQAEIEQLNQEISKYSKLNPESIKEKQRLSIVAFDAANRWTDNIFSIKSWCTKKFNLQSADFDKSFEIPEDFDYLE
ncbi:meiotic nuclear division protein 1 [Histomonas meleagridis]|uniref:meiotic nuclear division protein 1-like n=1 Tax=Histomonas meleagridis TaxID=135588 RepID=UPI0035595E00|nr:meiotic nuclear division protein 1 [Histomonas meleagridis]KAH0801518.1 meiotic nuclear division protein 1-like [Histomonas meleagridis]